jgi:hypothetical protein
MGTRSSHADLNQLLALLQGVVSPNRRKFRQAGFQAFGRLAAYPVSRYTFCGSRDRIDLDALLANLIPEEGEQRLSPIVDSIRLVPKCRWKLPDGNFAAGDRMNCALYFGHAAAFRDYTGVKYSLMKRSTRFLTRILAAIHYLTTYSGGALPRQGNPGIQVALLGKSQISLVRRQSYFDKCNSSSRY